MNWTRLLRSCYKNTYFIRAGSYPKKKKIALSVQQGITRHLNIAHHFITQIPLHIINSISASCAFEFFLAMWEMMTLHHALHTAFLVFFLLLFLILNKTSGSYIEMHWCMQHFILASSQLRTELTSTESKHAFYSTTERGEGRGHINAWQIHLKYQIERGSLGKQISCLVYILFYS